MAKVQQTANYDKFVLNSFNRDVNDTSALEKSMKKYGWLDPYPMHVIESGGFYVIVGGHNRFEAAKKIGIPVKYVICDDEVPIADIEPTTKPWSIYDYLISHARTGKEDYIHVSNYVKKTGFSVSICIAVCAGSPATAANMNLFKRFKTGTFKIGDQSHAEQLHKIAFQLHKIGVDFCRNTNFVKSISKCLFVDKFDIAKFLKNAKTHKHFFERKPTIDGYVEMIDKIYNRGSRNIIPLAFLASEASKKRSILTAKK